MDQNHSQLYRACFHLSKHGKQAANNGFVSTWWISNATCYGFIIMFPWFAENIAISCYFWVFPIFRHTPVVVELSSTLKTAQTKAQPQMSMSFAGRNQNFMSLSSF